MENCVVEFKKVDYGYQDDSKKAIMDIQLNIACGEFVLIAGASGSGKTTVAKCINGLIPYFHEGTLAGGIIVQGKGTNDMELHEIGEQVGSVFQDPRSQFFTTNTTDEVAFGCQNMGLSRSEIFRRVDAAFSCLDIEALKNRSLFRISSGEKQKIAIASCCAMEPGAYVFDEPSANLDIASTLQLAQIMRRLKEAGNTVIVIEHRLYYLTDLVDRVVYMSEGRIQKVLFPGELPRLSTDELSKMGLRQFYLEKMTYKASAVPKNNRTSLAVKGLAFTYKKHRRPEPDGLLRGVDFAAAGGEIIGIVGKNGAGKTTLTKLCCGLLKEDEGVICLNGKRLSAKDRLGRIYFVMQDSDYQLFSDSVIKELKLGAAESADLEVQCEKNLAELGLLEYKDCHPAALSQGQKQRLTIAAAMMSRAEAVFFDEPTSGLDGKSMGQVAGRLHALAAGGAVVFVVSHDYEFLLSSCSRILHLYEGRMADDFNLSHDSAGRLKDILFGTKGGV